MAGLGQVNPVVPMGGLTKEETEILATLQKKASLSDNKPVVETGLSLLKKKSNTSISTYFDKMNSLQGFR
jgi:hypothetical protein